MSETGNQEKHVKKAFFWNMAGSTCYSASSFLFLMAVNRLCGVETAGFFSLCYATAQLLLTVGRYGMRTYQATDLDRKYSFREYQISRLITCCWMMAGAIAYALFSFRGREIAACVLIVLIKMVDAVEDVYHGNLQQVYHVETMGKLLAFRNIFTTVVFCLSLWLWKDLFRAALVTSVTSLAVCLAANAAATRKIQPFAGDLCVSHIRQLLLHCTPLFLGTFLSLLLYNIPKYAMSGILDYEYQTYYSILFMPSFVITLMCEFLFKPTITTIAQLWWDGKLRRFAGYVGGILALILLADLAVIAAGHLLGRRLLELFYGVSLEPYRLHFIVLLAGGGFSSMVYLMYNVIIAIRKEKVMLPVYVIVTVLTVLPVRWMVRRFSMMGACLNYLYSCLLLAVIFGSILFVVYRRRKAECLA